MLERLNPGFTILASEPAAGASALADLSVRFLHVPEELLETLREASELELEWSGRSAFSITRTARITGQWVEPVRSRCGRHRDEAVQVIAITHQSRDPEIWKRRA